MADHSFGRRSVDPARLRAAQRLAANDTIFNPPAPKPQRPSRMTGWGETIGVLVFLILVFGVAILA